MGSRGRKSAAALAVVTAETVERLARPQPPAEPTSEQAEEWRSVVSRLPAEWFPRETWGLLAQYCRHVVAARRIAQLIAEHEAGEDFDVEKYDTLLKMQEREGRALSSLATRMRLTQHSTYDKTKRKPLKGRAPWSPEQELPE